VRSGKIFLDTNILVYAIDELSPFHKKAKEVRDKASEGKNLLLNYPLKKRL